MPQLVQKAIRIILHGRLPCSSGYRQDNQQSTLNGRMPQPSKPMRGMFLVFWLAFLLGGFWPPIRNMPATVQPLTVSYFLEIARGILRHDF